MLFCKQRLDLLAMCLVQSLCLFAGAFAIVAKSQQPGAQVGTQSFDLRRLLLAQTQCGAKIRTCAAVSWTHTAMTATPVTTLRPVRLAFSVQGFELYLLFVRKQGVELVPV